MESKTYLLKSKSELAEGIIKLELVPEDGNPIQYSPGQFMILTLPSGTKRAYSIASAPNSDVLEFAIKLIDGEFTSQLPNLNNGAKFTVDGPLGPFIYNTCGEYVLIAGGIGITPMISILRDRDGNNECEPVTLFYSARTRKNLAYLKELEEIDSRNTNLTSVFTLTREAPKDWNYELGHIDEKMLRKYVSDLKQSRYFVCGPSKMVDACKVLLEELGVPQENCTFEGWNV